MLSHLGWMKTSARVRDDTSLSRSSISEFVRLWWELKFQENEEEWPRIVETVRFFTMTTL